MHEVELLSVDAHKLPLFTSEDDAKIRRALFQMGVTREAFTQLDAPVRLRLRTDFRSNFIHYSTLYPGADVGDIAMAAANSVMTDWGFLDHGGNTMATAETAAERGKVSPRKRSLREKAAGFNAGLRGFLSRDFPELESNLKSRKKPPLSELAKLHLLIESEMDRICFNTGIWYADRNSLLRAHYAAQFAAARLIEVHQKKLMASGEAIPHDRRWTRFRYSRLPPQEPLYSASNGVWHLQPAAAFTFTAYPAFLGVLRHVSSQKFSR